MRLAITLLLASAAAPLMAQANPAPAGADASLEQSYASQCAGKAQPESEVCAALRKALVAKLSAQTDAVVAPNVTQSSQSAQPASTLESLRRKWGIYADLVGKTYFAKLPAMGHVLASYRWKVPDRSIGFYVRETNSRAEPKGQEMEWSELRWSAPENAAYIAGYNGRSYVGVEADGATTMYNADGKHRTRMMITGPGQWVAETERSKNGGWKHIDYGTVTYNEFTPALAAQLRAGSSGGGLLGVLQGAVAGAAGMASGGGGYDAAIAGAAAGAVAGAAGVDAGSIQTGFATGAAEVNAQNAALEAEMAAAAARAEEARALAAARSASPAGANGGITVAATDIASAPAPASAARTAAAAPAPAMAASKPAMPSAPRMCTTPGGSREWSTGQLASLKDAQAEYEQEAAFQRAKGSSMSPMQASGKTIAVFGVPHAVCTATITWPAKTSPCGSTVSPQ